jgi:hypothetical protein
VPSSYLGDIWRFKAVENSGQEISSHTANLRECSAVESTRTRMEHVLSEL